MELEVYCSNECRGCKWQGPLRIFIKEHALACVQKEIEKAKLELSMLEQDEKIYKHHSTSPDKNLYCFKNLSEAVPKNGIELPLTETVYIKNFKEKPVIDARTLEETTGVSEKHLTSKKLPQSSTFNFDDSAEYVDKCTSDLLEKNKKFKEELGDFDTKLELHSKRTNATFTQLCTKCSAVMNPNDSHHNIRVKDEHTDSYTTDFMDFSKVGKPQTDSCMQCHWGIDINKCLQRKVNSLFSPPWYNAPCGYQLQLLLYPNGYGHCMGTHASIFLTIVRGAHDGRLSWPVTGTFSMVILDLYHNARPIVKTFQLSCSFNKPEQNTTQNTIVATGCSEFISKEIILNKRYVENGIIRLEFKFNPSCLQQILS